MTDAVLTRDQIRGRRKREVQARTEVTQRFTKRRLRQIREETNYPEGVIRPRTRGDCTLVPRPCPFVSCCYHLYLDVSQKTGSIKLNFPDLEVWEMPHPASCALDVADRGGATLEEVGEVLNVTRERIRQLEVSALQASRIILEALESEPCKLHELAELMYGAASFRNKMRTSRVLHKAGKIAKRDGRFELGEEDA